MDFYTKLIELCKRKGVSRSKMADDIGISRSSPQGWAEKGAVPRFETMKKIADYFGVDISYFSEGDVAVQTVQNNNGFIGTTNAPVTFNNTPNQNLGDIEKELIAICGRLNMKRKNALLAKAYELLEAEEA
jgi:transcriptional regulator with XRE-family HTH domain